MNNEKLKDLERSISDGNRGILINEIVKCYAIILIGFPFPRIEVTVSRSVKSDVEWYHATLNVVPIDPATNVPEGLVCGGATPEDAAAEMISAFMEQCRSMFVNNELERSGFAFRQPDGSYS